MSAEKLRKVRKQLKTTSLALHRRLIGLSDPLDSLFDPEVGKFVDLQAKSLNTYRGYLVSCIITQNRLGARSPLMCMIFSSAQRLLASRKSLKNAQHHPWKTWQKNFPGVVLSSEKVLLQLCANLCHRWRWGLWCHQKYSTYFMNYWSLIRTINASGDTHLLYKLFTAEKCTFRYATERPREIPGKTPFSQQGATQVPYTVELLCQLDQGNRLLERLLITIPSCLRLMVAARQEAAQQLSNSRVTKFAEIFIQTRRMYVCMYMIISTG